jgi:hypothetical protein
MMRKFNRETWRIYVFGETSLAETKVEEEIKMRKMARKEANFVNILELFC